MDNFYDKHGREWISLKDYAEENDISINTLSIRIRDDDIIAPEYKTKHSGKWYLLRSHNYQPRPPGRPVTTGAGLKRPDRIRKHYPNRPDLRSLPPERREFWKRITSPAYTEPADTP